jgi:hypothetical protein
MSRSSTRREKDIGNDVVLNKYYGTVAADAL